MALSAKAHNFIFTVLFRRHLHCPHCYRPLSSSSSPLPTATRPPVDPYRGHFAHPGQSSRVIKKPTFPNLSFLQETNANFFFDSENQLTDLRSRSRIWDPPVPQECPRSVRERPEISRSVQECPGVSRSVHEFSAMSKSVQECPGGF